MRNLGRDVVGTSIATREETDLSSVRRLRGLVLASIVAVPFIVVLAAPAMASSSKADPQVVFTGKVVVTQGETVGDVVIFDGPVTIDGTVRGSLTSFNGDVAIAGTVTGDVTSFKGTVTLRDGARIGGNLVTQSTPIVASGAKVDGSRQRVDTQVLLGRIQWISGIAVWVAVSISTLVFGLVLLWFVPKAAEAVAATARERVGASIGWGFALFFGIPILSVIALVTVVGIPFGLGMLLGLGLIYTFGYTASSLALGRALVKAPSHRFLAFLAGWALLRVASIVPFLGGLVWFAAIVYGLGSLAAAARGSQKQEPVAVAAPMPPPPPMPVM